MAAAPPHGRLGRFLAGGDIRASAAVDIMLRLVAWNIYLVPDGPQLSGLGLVRKQHRQVPRVHVAPKKHEDRDEQNEHKTLSCRSPFMLNRGDEPRPSRSKSASHENLENRNVPFRSKW
jgi:hypothetical protein